jgi:hypothetical protein
MRQVGTEARGLLPADLTYGTYDVKYLGSAHGSLSVGGVALDKTWGYRAIVPSPDCCGFGAPPPVPLCLGTHECARKVPVARAGDKVQRWAP